MNWYKTVFFIGISISFRDFGEK